MVSFRQQGELTTEEQADLICVESYPSARQAHQAGTAILAMGHWYVVLPEEATGGYGLHVPSGLAEEAAQAVLKSRREGQSWPPADPVENPVQHAVSWIHFFPVPLLLIGVFLFTHSAGGGVWLEWGRFDSAAIREQGEWWRLFTPLFLHADAGHLWGNILGGCFFGGWLASRVGIARVYWGALLSGGLGNLLNLVTFWNAGHLSIGASTAVFGLLGGILGQRVYDLRAGQKERASASAVARKRDRWKIIGAISAGLVLLGWLGAGSARTDVLAHLYGFISGFVLFVWLLADRKRDS